MKDKATFDGFSVQVISIEDGDIQIKICFENDGVAGYVLTPEVFKVGDNFAVRGIYVEIPVFITDSYNK